MNNGRHPNGRETKFRHNRQLITQRKGKFLDVLAQSILGLADVYNLLLAYVVDADDTSTFQGMLQEILVAAAGHNVTAWPNIFSPRNAVFAHPLRDTLRIKFATGEIMPTVETYSRASTCVRGWLSFGQ